jgi:endogenous inhibitor of DNA gyrase (YacG/DUF329 family)
MTMFPKDAPVRLKGKALGTFDCKGCGVKVERIQKRLRRGGRFCSTRCYYRSKQEVSKTRHRKCAECGIEFTNKNALKFCGAKCSDVWRSKRKTKTCAECGVQFSIQRPCLRVKFCSQKCMGLGTRKPLVKTICPNCHSPFEHRQMGGRTRIYCSKACKTEHYRDANHPGFRGDRRQYRGKDWKYQSALARIRDMNTCANCGDNSEKNISVDHIVPFRMCRTFQEGKNPNGLINLICLCRRCHMRKTQMEKTVLRGDVMGFIAKAKAVIDRDRLLTALDFWGLYRPAKEIA